MVSNVGWANYSNSAPSGLGLTALSIAMPYTNFVGAPIPTNAYFYFSNITTGGSTVALVNGAGFLTTLGSNPAPASVSIPGFGGFINSGATSTTPVYIPAWGGSVIETTEPKAECPVLAGTYSNIFVGLYNVAGGTNFTVTAMTNGVAAFSFTSGANTAGSTNVMLWANSGVNSFTANTNGMPLSLKLVISSGTLTTAMSWSSQKVN